MKIEISPALWIAVNSIRGNRAFGWRIDKDETEEVEKQHEEQDNAAVSGDFEDVFNNESEETEGEELDEDKSESEGQGITMWV